MDRVTDTAGQLFACGNSLCAFEPRQLCTDCMYQHAANKRLAAYEDTGLTPEEVSEVAQAKRESCDTCRQKQDGGSWLFNVYPCRECRNRTKSHYEAAEAALGEGEVK